MYLYTYFFLLIFRYFGKYLWYIMLFVCTYTHSCTSIHPKPFKIHTRRIVVLSLLFLKLAQSLVKKIIFNGITINIDWFALNTNVRFLTILVMKISGHLFQNRFLKKVCNLGLWDVYLVAMVLLWLVQKFEKCKVLYIHHQAKLN